MPAANPNTSAVRPNSLFIVSAANPTLTRSKMEMSQHRIRNGMRRHAALRDARRAAVSATFKSATIVRKLLSSHGPAIFSGQTIGELLREPITPLDLARLAQLLAKCK